MRLDVKNVTFAYPSSPRPAVKNADFTVPEGGFALLCGASGSGKSTLLRLLKPGLMPHGEFSGEIIYDGKTAVSDCRAGDIGFVLQNPTAITDKVWHELAFGGESVGMDSREIRKSVAECAEYFGLERLFRRDTAFLSGGESTLVSLAAAAALHPRFLIADEPTSQLDPIAAREFADMLQRLNRDFGITILIAEHRLEEFLPLCGKVIVMENGELIADCPPRELADALPDGHIMRDALPVAVRVFSLAERKYGKTGGGPPVTVREGRQNALCRRYLTENPPEKRPPFLPKEKKPLIDASELWVSYGKGVPDTLRSVTISLYEGEVLALLGGNGSGKTTLLKTLAGIIKPLGGKVKYRHGTKIAYLPQNPCAVLQSDSVIEELTSRGASGQTAREYLGKFGLGEEYYGAHPFDLSGGERQRLALAALLFDEPDVLLADEPSKGMDAFSKRKFADMLREISGHTASLVSTHDVEFAAMCGDECALLFDGEIAAREAPDEFFSSNYFYTTPLCRLARGITEEE